MALSIPSFPNPFDSKTPLTSAYGWISGITLDLAKNSGQCVVSIHPNPDSWQSQPVAQVIVSLGQQLTPDTTTTNEDGAQTTVPGAKFTDLATLMADPEFAAAFNVIGQKLYAVLPTVPALSGSNFI